MSNLPPPRYTLIETIRVACAMGLRALEEVRALARIPGPQGEQGLPGICYDDVKVLQEDDGRIVIWQFFRGEKLLKEVRHVTATVLDRGVWREGKFFKGDGVSWGGSFWIAQRETDEKPGEGKSGDNSGWRLAVKRGRDGKDGPPGAKGLPGQDGRPGRDLTRVYSDGPQT